LFPTEPNQMNVQPQKGEERLVRSWKQPSTHLVFPSSGREEKAEAEVHVRDDPA